MFDHDDRRLAGIDVGVFAGPECRRDQLRWPIFQMAAATTTTGARLTGELKRGLRFRLRHRPVSSGLLAGQRSADEHDGDPLAPGVFDRLEQGRIDRVGGLDNEHSRDDGRAASRTRSACVDGGSAGPKI